MNGLEFALAIDSQSDGGLGAEVGGLLKEPLKIQNLWLMV
jgi:hypothetical protein